MTSFYFGPPQFCQYAIRGHIYVQRRGSYWEPEDELQRHARQNDSGVVLIDCETEDQSGRVRELLDAGGFIAGTDYGIYSFAGNDTCCPGIRVDRMYGRQRVEAFGNHDWKLPPRPPAVVARHNAMLEKDGERRFEFFSRVMLAIGTDPKAIEAAGNEATSSAKIDALLKIRCR